MDEYEELEPLGTFAYAPKSRTLENPAHNVSALEDLCRLGEFAYRIFGSLYSEIGSSVETTEPQPRRYLSQTFHHMQAELSQWRDRRPATAHLGQLGHYCRPMKAVWK